MANTTPMADLHGLLNFNKPSGITSAKALYRVRKIVGQRKSGHTGTLDPLADGVLVLTLGRATKLTELVMDRPKVYRAHARLDVTSESFDADRPLIDVPVSVPPDVAQVRRALAGFEGVIEQLPPAVSAIKIGGAPAYKLQRGGQAPELKPRHVRIYWLRLRRFDWPNIAFDMACGRGAYVRAVIRDLGNRLNTGGCLTGLTRLAVGPFGLETAFTFEQLERAATPADCIIALEQARSLLEAPIQIPVPTDAPC